MSVAKQCMCALFLVGERERERERELWCEHLNFEEFLSPLASTGDAIHNERKNKMSWVACDMRPIVLCFVFY